MNIQQLLAEHGLERTPEEVLKIVTLYNMIYEQMDLNTYLLFKNMTNEDVFKAGKSQGLSPKASMDIHEMMMIIGRKKWEKKS